MWSLFYRNYRLLILTIFIIIVWGISSFQLLPRMEDPELSQWYSFIITPYPGATAERVESLVTEKIEQELFEIEEIKTINSTSMVGKSYVRIQLKDTVRDFEQVWSKVRDRLADVTPQLPQGALEPEFKEIDQRAYTLIVALTWNSEPPANYAILRRLAEELKEELRVISGTEEVDLFGEPIEEIVVEINPANLAALGITPQDLSQQIQLSDAKVATGQLRSPSNDLLLEIESELDSLERIRQIPIRLSNSGQFARLGDVALVKKGIREPPPELAIIDGKPGIALAIRVEPQQRIEQWAIAAHQTLEQFRQHHLEGIDLQPILDQSRYVANRLNSLFNNLLLGALFVLASTFLMMGWKSALVISSALLLSILMVFGGMRMLGIPLHQMSVTGLVIALGLLIDNAIVVVDEVQHLLKRGFKPQTAISKSVSYLAIPLLTSNLTTILTFLPITLLSGQTGEFVRTIAFSVILALLSSLFLSLTIIPALIGSIHRKAKEQEREKGQNSQFPVSSLRSPVPNSQFSSQNLQSLPGKKISQINNRLWSQGFSHPYLTQFYRLTQDFILAKPRLGILLALILPLIGFLTASSLQEQFFPPAERDQFHIELELPSSASLEKTQSVVQESQDIILNHTEVANVHWFLGNHAPEFYYNLPRRAASRSNYAHGIVQLTDQKDLTKLIPRLQNELNQALPSVSVLVRQLEQGPYIAAPIELRLYGSDLQVLQALGKQIRLVLTQVSGITNTRSSLSEALPTLALHLDEEKAKLTGLDHTFIAKQLNTSLEGSLAGSIIEDTEELPVRVRLSNSDRANLDQITTLGLVPNNQLSRENSTFVPLSALGQIKLVPETPIITRRNGQRVNTVQGFITAGVLPSNVLADFKQRLSDSNFQLPPGYSLEWGGETA